MAGLNIQIEIHGRDAGASGVLGGITNTVRGLGTVAGGVLTLGLGAATVGIGALAAGFGLAISEAMGAQEVMAQTEAVIRSTGGAAGMTADEVAELATALSLQSRFSDDAIQTAENLLLTFTNIGEDVFPLATQAMVDMATAMGTDVQSGAIQLGKALNDPVAGITALTRVGVSFTDEQKDVIKALVETGDVAGAQAIILAELNKEFGGSASAAAETFAGKLDVMKNRLLNVAEAIGGPLLDVGADLIDRFLLPILPMVEAFGTTFASALGLFVSGDIAGGFDILAQAVGKVFGRDGYEAIQAFGDFVTGALIPAFQNLRDFVVENLPIVQGWIADAFGWITEHGEEIKGALIAIGAVLGGAAIVGAITAIGAAIATLISPVGLVIAAAALLGAAWAGNWGGIRDILTDFWNNTALPILTDLWTWLQVNVPIAIQTLSDYWTGTLQPALEQVWDWIVANWPTIQATAKAVFDEVIAIAGQVVSYFQTTLIPAFNAAVQWVVANWPTIQATINTVIAAVVEFVSAALAALQAFWAEHGEAILTIVGNLWSTIQTNFTTAVEIISTVVTTALDVISFLWDQWGETIMGIVSNAFESIGLWIDAFIALFTGDWEALGESLRGIWDNLWENIKGIVTAGIDTLLAIDWAAIGTAILQGVADGIMSAHSFLTEAAQSAASAAFEAAKAFLGISSPSTLFAGLGVNMMRGMALGIDTSASLPAAATASAAAGAAGAVHNTWNVYATYPYQSAGSVAQELRLRSALETR